jgi:hypothetical protein
MSGFKLCPNGHYFQENLDECPYCPANQHKFTVMENDKTRIDDPGASDQTRIIPPETSDLGKTRIFHGNPANDENAFTSGEMSSDRKLVGWLVSFTMDPNGTDFRLYEGRNILGSDPGCDIYVPSDPLVSSRHLTILFRMGSFKFKDELSTNGTFINDEFKEEGNLADGDTIKIGNTIFKFRTVA